MKRNIPEVFLGALMAVAIFAMGFVVASSLWPQQRGFQSQQATQGVEQNGQQLTSFWQRTTDDPVAFFTLWIMLFTGVVVVANIGLWLVTRRTLDHSRHTADKQLRAYVHVEHAKIDQADDGLPAVASIRFKNCGSTPAYQVRSTILCKLVFEGDLESKETKKRVARYADLGPAQGRTTLMPMDAVIWPMMKHGIESGVGTFYVFGEITYYDAFQDRMRHEPHFTRYRFQVVGIRKDGSVGLKDQ